VTIEEEVTMFQVTATATIARPVDEVFAFLLDPGGYPRWIDDVKEVRAPRARFAPGDRFDEVTVFNGQLKRSKGEILEVVPGSRLVMQIREVLSGPGLKPTRCFEVEGSRATSTLKWTSTVETSGLMWWMQPLLPGMFRKKKAGYLAVLKRLLEAPA
jgi:uncharacterized protein YndB with AHSA1/START domain